MGGKNTIGSLDVNLTTDTAKFKKGLKEAEDKLNTRTARMRRSLARFDRSVGKVTKRMGGLKAAAVGAAVLGFFFLTKRAVESADKIAKTADAIGISTDALQEYRFAANLAGTSTEAFDKAAKQLTKGIGEARSNTGTLITILKKSNPELLRQLQTARDSTTAFNIFFKALANTSNHLDRVALSAAGFGGRGGKDMVLLVKDGAEGLAAMRREARELGFVIEENLLRASEKANDQLERMRRVVGTNLTKLFISLAPQIIRVGDAFVDASPKIKRFIDEALPDDLQSLETLSRRAAHLRNLILDLQKNPTGSTTASFLTVLFGGTTANEATIESMQKRLDRLQPLIEQARRAERAISAGLSGDLDDGPKPLTAVETTIQALERKSEQLQRTAFAQRFHNELTKAGITLEGEQAGKIRELVLGLERLERAAKVKTVVAALEAERAALSRSSIEQRIHTELQRAGIDADDKRAKSIRTLVGEIEELTEAQKKQAEAQAFAEATFDATRSPLERFREQMRLLELSLALNKQTLGEAGISWETYRRAVALARAELKGLSTDSIFGKPKKSRGVPGTRSGVPGSTGGVPGSGGLGFAHGGAFTVAGTGGTDSQLVAFRATPGERVEVKTPGQQSAGLVLNIDARGADVGVERRLRNLIRRMGDDAVTRAAFQVSEAAGRSGSQQQLAA